MGELYDITVTSINFESAAVNNTIYPHGFILILYLMLLCKVL